MAKGKPVSAASAFDSIAKPKSAVKKASTKIAATVTDEVKAAVDEVISTKAEIERKKALLGQQEQIVIEHVQPQQDAKARSGEFSKSFYVEGNDGAVLYSTADSFSVPQEETDQETLKQLIGEDRFQEWFKKKRTIALKETVNDNQELLGKILAVITASGMTVDQIFTVTDVLAATKDLDQKQYALDDQTLTEFRALVKPRKASLKGTSKEA